MLAALLAGAAITAGHPHRGQRYRHGWIPVSGGLFKNAEEKRQYQSLHWRGKDSYKVQRAMGSRHQAAFRHALRQHGVGDPAEEAAHAARVRAAREARRASAAPIVARSGRGPFRFRHGWIPIGGRPSESPRARSDRLLHEAMQRHAVHSPNEPSFGRGEHDPAQISNLLFGKRQQRSQPGAPAGAVTPLNDAEYEAHTRQVEDKIGAALKAGKATDKTEAIDADAGVWKPERAAVHKQIVNDMYDRQAKTAGSDGKAVIAGGLGGAGKSTVLGKYAGIDSKDYVTVNPDDVKEEMAKRGLIPEVPGLSPMERSALVHEESSHIANLIAQRALTDKKNIIYDITMSSKGSVQKRLAKLADHGYSKPRAVFVDIPVETSVSRALGRHRRGMEEHRAGAPGALGGRYVPPSVIRANKSSTSNSSNRDVFNSLRDQFGNWDVYDTSGEGGPKLVESRGGPAPLDYGKGVPIGSEPR